MSWKKFAMEDGAEALAELGSMPGGLRPGTVEERLRAFEKERGGEKRGSLPWKDILKRRARSSFLYLLLAAAGLSFFLGDRLDALLISVFIAINVGLETYQEYRSEKAASLLRRYLVVHAKVRRGGRTAMIESCEIVPGDSVLVEAGDRLPADMRFLRANSLELDESAITGESIAVRKTADTMPVPPGEMHEAQNIGFAGTVVTAGCGEGVVFAVGRNTALGDIAALVGETERETVFEKGIAQFSRFILKLVLFTLAVVFVANVFLKEGGNTGGLLIFYLALAVSVVPEALPVIITVALSRGSLRLAQKKVVVKRLSAIEDLGSIEILCTDKTGTLTENILSVSRLKAADERECLRLAFAACLEVPTERGNLHDAFDLALWQALSGKEREEVSRMKRLDAIPFDPERRRNSVLLGPERSQAFVVVRGAPEEILRRSGNVDAYAARDAMRFIAETGRSGARVLAVARKPFAAGGNYTAYDEQGLEFVGLIAFADTLKGTAERTIRKAEALNVQVKILTGDSREAAGAVGYAVGLLRDPANVVTGEALEEMPLEERRKAIFSGTVFARVSPRQKYEIIRILQEKRQVGFLGEGINDAPALRIANAAIVVQGASDIAREAADVVLLQKSLETVIDGIREGRTIFANILKYLKVTLTSNFGNFYSVALASLFLPFVPLLPVQILLLNLLSDFPMIAIATDTADAEELRQPKSYQIHSIILMATLFGVVSSVFDFILFGAFYEVSPEALQTAWFLLSLATEVVLIFSLRTKFSFFRAPRASFLLTHLSLAALAGAFILPFTLFGTGILHFIRPDFSFLAIIAALSLGYFLATETVKRFYYQHFNGIHTFSSAGKKNPA